MSRTAGGRTSGAGSRAEGVRDKLRADIMSGRFEPGRRLTFPELCAEYSVSVGVLREALVRLVDHGIVRAESNLGFSVMPLSDADLIGLTHTRALVEPRFVREAVQSGSVQWEAQLVAAHHVMDKSPAGDANGPTQEWVDAHAEFHLALVAGTENRRMLEITQRLRREADLYRRWYQDAKQIERHSKVVAREHRALLQAALKRDPDMAEALARKHIERATDTWLGDRPTAKLAVKSA